MLLCWSIWEVVRGVREFVFNFGNLEVLFKSQEQKKALGFRFNNYMGMKGSWIPWCGVKEVSYDLTDYPFPKV